MAYYSDAAAANAASRDAWETNAASWDDHMGVGGNDFVNLLIWPGLQKLLGARGGETILDVACGNGLYALRLAELGARVVGFDFSTELIARARSHSALYGNRITCHVIDASDLTAMLALGEGQFDAACSQMALMDMAEIDPLASALRRLIRPGGRFVFAVMHPCFNGLHTTFAVETPVQGEESTPQSALMVSRYMTPFTGNGLALRQQTQPQPYFHRPLHDLLRPFFRAGFVMDALEEAAFPPEYRPDKVDSWSGVYSEFPPVLMVRLQNPEE